MLDGAVHRLLPPGVAVAERTGDVEPPPLAPEEAAAAPSASAGRRRQLAASRACAREAIAWLGMTPAPVGSGPDREPLWPPGVVGGITHCAGYCAAAVARRDRCAAVGIDAEVDRPLPRGVVDRVARDEERAWLAARRDAGAAWDRLLFSAKESVFKAWFPLTGRWLGFHDAIVTFDPPSRTFLARLLVPGPVVDGRQVAAFEGRYAVADGLLLTAIAVVRD